MNADFWLLGMAAALTLLIAGLITIWGYGIGWVNSAVALASSVAARRSYNNYKREKLF